MLPRELRVNLLVALTVFLIVILSLLKKRRLALKYKLLWLLTVVVMLILVLFPDLLLRVAPILGIQSVMNALYFFLIGFILIILMSLTSIVSVQKERIRKLAECNALLEQRMRHLETCLKKEIINEADSD